jgi:hypothetical protein
MPAGARARDAKRLSRTRDHRQAPKPNVSEVMNVIET